MLLTSGPISLVICLAIVILAGVRAGDRGSRMDSSTSLPANWAWLVPGWFLAHVCYQSPVYQILDDEVVVRAAVSTHCVEHVPQRTVTNVRVKRHIPDRHLGIDTFGLQTAGVSSTPGPQDSLVRLSECQGMYQPVATALRRCWAARPPQAVATRLLFRTARCVAP